MANHLFTLGLIAADQDQHESPARLFGEAIETRRKALPATHPDTGACLVHLSKALLALRRHAEAEPLLVEALGINREKFGLSHAQTQESLKLLSRLYEEQRRPEKALEYRALLSQTGS